MASAETVKHGKHAWPLLAAAEMAGVCGFGEEMLRKLERAGVFSKVRKGRYDPYAVIIGLLAHLRDEERRASRTAAASEVQRERALEIRQRRALAAGELLQRDDVEAFCAAALSNFRSELAGLPAAATRDLAIRRKIEGLQCDAFARLEQAFAKYDSTDRLGINSDDAPAPSRAARRRRAAR